jgi:type VI secretion system protein ImpC
MSKPSSFADVELDIEARPRPWLERPEAETPFRILVLGDFTGRANRGLLESRLAGRRPHLVDRDSFELLLDKLKPELRLPLEDVEAASVTLKFSELDDFHPDRIFERSELFRALRGTRDRLANPSTFAEAAQAFRPAPPPKPVPSSEKFTLDDLLGSAPAAQPQRALDDWGRLVRDLVAPHLVPGADPRQPELLAQFDATISAQMRALLHHPDFQQIEAAWRALFFLVRRLETSSDLKVFLLDISKAELALMLEEAREDLRASDLYKLLVSDTVDTPGAEPWAALCTDYSFDASQPDLEALARLGAIAQKAGAPVLGGAADELLAGMAGAAWLTLRKMPIAQWIGLAMPRFLLRLPYGSATNPTECFDFEEMPRHEHRGYLWGNAAFACASLLGHAFSHSGWDMRAGAIRQLADLPLHTYKQDGETNIQPCAEVLMREQQAEALLDNGIMPLASLKDRDAILLVRVQSIADPLAPLAGRWQ